MSLAENLSLPTKSARHLKSVKRPPSTDADAPNRLRVVLVCTDVAATILGWLVVSPFVETYRRPWHVLATVAVATAATAWMIQRHDLYLSRVSSVRSVELSRLARAIALAGLIVLAAMQIFDIPGGLRVIIPSSIATMLLLVVGRGSFRAWLAAQRRSGRFLRDVIIVGVSDEARDLHDLVNDHPETGYRIVGVMGDRDEAMLYGLSHLWSGGIDETIDALDGRQVSGVIIATTALSPTMLNDTVRLLQSHRVHIQLSNGMRGIDFRRLTAAPIAYEPIFYLEPAVLSRGQLVLKRALDLLLGAIAIVLASPLMAAIALAIKLQDGGPVLFRQLRVGRDGERFKVLKFRTMVVDAEAKLAALRAENERNGPLFKMERDPRITRLGHFLRNSSLDELPQLLNVMTGQMSLVGPRPALPSEVALFDDVLLNRTKVPPGITGLWQVEARDNPSFSAYRRLDLFYVENWSVALDLVIMLATIEQVVAKLVFSLIKRRK